MKISEKEHDQLMTLAKSDEGARTKEGRVNLSKYMRKCIFGQASNINIKQEISNTKMQIRKANVNLNRIMMHLEKTNSYDKNLLNELNVLQQSFSKMMNRLLEREKENGDN